MPTDFDEWPDEPEEPDPEARWGDPESDLVSVPTVEDAAGDESAGADDDSIGVDDESAGVDVDSDLAKFFWVTVIYANVAIAGVSIGLLLVAFRQQWLWGGGAVAVGLFALYRAYDLYRTYREYIAEESDAESDEASADDTDG